MATLIRPAKNDTYYINPGTLTFVENSGYGVQLIQVSASSSCYISVLDKENGIRYNENSELRKWKITAYNNKFPEGDTTPWNIYVRLERQGTAALIVYDKKNRAVSGGVITELPDGTSQVGDADPSFYYIKIGTVGETDGVSKIREIVYDTGYLDTPESNQAVGEVLSSMFRPHYDNPDNPEELTWIEALSNLGVAGGVSSYIQSKGMDVKGIYDGLPIDNITLYWELLEDGSKVLKSLGTGNSEGSGGVADSVAWSNITGKPLWLLDNKIDYAEIDGVPDLSGFASKEWISEQSFASSSEVEGLQKTLESFLSGSDADEVINKWQELEIFLSGLKETDKLSEILKGKADKSTTLAGYGIADAYTKADVDGKLSAYVTLAGKQTITGEKDFAGGLRVNGMPLVYDANKKYWKLEGDLLVTGGVASYSSDTSFNPSTVMDGVMVDDVTIRKNSNGHLEVIGGSGGLNLEELGAYLYDNGYVNDVEMSGSGNAVTSASIVNNKLVVNKESRFALASALNNYQEKITTSSKLPYSLISETPDLSVYATKATTLAGYGITDAYTKSDVDGKLSDYVTLAGKQTITGEKNFAGGLKVNGMPLVYDSSKKYWKLEGDLLVTGGVASYSSDTSFNPSTIMDGVMVDDVTIRKNGDGRLEVIGGSGGLDLEELDAYLYKNGYVNDVEMSGSGNAITSASIVNNKLVVNKEERFALASALNNYQTKITSSNKLSYSLISGTPDLSVYATKATTLAGYGIADAYTKEEQDDRYLRKSIGLNASDVDYDKLYSSAIYNNTSGNGTNNNNAPDPYGLLFVFGRDGYAAQMHISSNNTVKVRNRYYRTQDGVNGMFWNEWNTLANTALDTTFLRTFQVNGTFYSNGGLRVTGAAYFGGGTTYYLGSTGNINCNALTANGVTTLKGALSASGAASLASSLSVAGTFTSSSNAYFGGEIKGIAPTGATYTPWRIIQNDAALYIQAATNDGVNNRGKMYLTGMNAVKLEMLKLSSIKTEVLGDMSIDGETSTKTFKLNGGDLSYDSTNKYWKLEGDLLVTGGVASYSSDTSFNPSTVMDGVMVDDVTIRKNGDGRLEVIGGTGGGGLDVEELGGYLYSNHYVNSVSVTGSGNAVTTASISGNKLTLTKGTSFLSLAGGTMSNKNLVKSLNAEFLNGRESWEYVWKGNVLPSESACYKVMTISRTNDKGWVRLSVGSSDSSAVSLCAEYLISWAYLESTTADRPITIQCIYGLGTMSGRLFAVKTDLGVYDIYFNRSAWAQLGVTILGHSKSCSIKSFDMVAVTTVPAATYTSSLVSSVSINASNADTLDGVHLSSIMHQGSENATDDSQGNQIIPISKPSLTGLTNKYGAILQWCSNVGEKPSSTNTYNWYYQLVGTTSGDLMFRTRTNGADWDSLRRVLVTETSGNLVLNNQTNIGFKDTNGVGNSVLGFNSANELCIGFGTRAKGYPTIIDGSTISFYTGTSRALGMTLNSGGLTLEEKLTSNVKDGTAPFVVSSKTKVANLNADMVDDFSVSGAGFLYKKSVSVTDTTNSVWYVKVVLDVEWNYNRHEVLIQPNYNNVNGIVLIEFESHAASLGYRVKAANYNGCNCTGFVLARNTSSSKLELCLRMAGGASASANIQSTLNIVSSSKMTASEGAAVSWIELTKQTISSNYAHVIDSSLSVTSNVTAGKDLILSGTLKSVFGETNYNTFQNHNNGNISVSAATGDLYLGYVNTKSIVCNTPVIPYNHNELKLGTSTKRWQCTYSVNGDFSSQVSAKTLKVNGGNLTFDSTKLAWQLEGDLIVTGGVASYSSLTSFVPSTVMDGVMVDGKTIKKNTEGALEVIGGTGGGGGNIKTVSALPSNPQPDTLYILI